MMMACEEARFDHKVAQVWQHSISMCPGLAVAQDTLDTLDPTQTLSPAARLDHKHLTQFSSLRRLPDSVKVASLTAHFGGGRVANLCTAASDRDQQKQSCA